MSLFETATGRRPQHIFGKPDPAVLGTLLQSYDRKDMVMVGDRLSTDKKLAENAGIDFILVLSGEAKLSDLPGLERSPRWSWTTSASWKAHKRNTIPSIRTGEDFLYSTHIAHAKRPLSLRKRPFHTAFFGAPAGYSASF